MKARLYALACHNDPLIHAATATGAMVGLCGTFVRFGWYRRDIAVTCLRCLGAL